jgi:hypothetical protein
VKSIAAWLASFHGKSRPGQVQAPRHPAADSPPRQLDEEPAEVGVDFLASLLDLSAYARTREDQGLLGHLRWMRSAFEHWSAAAELEAGPQMFADSDEGLWEVIASFRAMANLGVERKDPELLRQLGRLQASWMSWITSARSTQGVPA